jgi:hypothetical protein
VVSGVFERAKRGASSQALEEDEEGVGWSVASWSQVAGVLSARPRLAPRLDDQIE